MAEAPRAEGKPGDSSSRIEVRVFSAPARLVLGALQVIAALNVLYLAQAIALDVLEGTQRAHPLALAQGLVLFSAVPLGLVALARRLARARLEISPAHILVESARTRFEIPFSSVKAVEPLRLPLPGSALALVMQSGDRFRQRFELADPGVFLSALGARLPSAEKALEHPTVRYARARHLGRRRWYWGFVKLFVLPLILTVILFRLHQFIVFGGPFGQYHLFGLGPYLRSFALLWAGTAGGLVVYAAVVRLVAEFLSFFFTYAAPSRDRLIRRVAEIFCLLAYFGLVPAYFLFFLLR
jgi:hypothetical protein